MQSDIWLDICNRHPRTFAHEPVSCSNDEFDAKESSISQLSGTIAETDLPFTINYQGTSVTIKASSENERIQTRAQEGPFYATGNMLQIASSKKLNVNYYPYVGVYFCDVFQFSKDIVLPAGAAAASVEYVADPGFTNYTTQEPGISWTMKTTASGKVLSFYFHTLRILYNTVGQQFNDVIPRDGNKIQIPYTIYY